MATRPRIAPLGPWAATTTLIALALVAVAATAHWLPLAHEMARGLYPDPPNPPDELAALELFAHNAGIVLAPWLLGLSGWKETKTTRLLATTAIAAIAAFQIAILGLGIGAWPEIIGLLAHLPIELAALAAGIQSYRIVEPGQRRAAGTRWAMAALLLLAVAAEIEAGQLPG